MKRFSVITILLSLWLTFAVAPSPALAKTRYYVGLQAVKEAKATKTCKLAKKANDLFLSLLDAEKTVTTRLEGNPAPRSKAFAAALKRQKLAGYATILRITTCKHELQPPQPGKSYKVLMVEVGIAIDAEKIPSGQLARAGMGSAQVGTEVSRIKPKELQSLREEALAAATKHAVKRFIATLDGKKTKKKSKARRSKRRRR
ncbi:MAG: hypothetical protein JRH20_11640 [Deltaproteobacteria bacterium]|nr:hypothetical protein [Deltaproteobacteria bacterium]